MKCLSERSEDTGREADQIRHEVLGYKHAKEVKMMIVVGFDGIKPIAGQKIEKGCSCQGGVIVSATASGMFCSCGCANVPASTRVESSGHY